MYLQQNSYSLDILSFSASWRINEKIIDFEQSYKEWYPYIVTNVNINHNIIKDKSTSWTKCYSRKFLIDNNIFYTLDKTYGEDLYYHIITYSKAKKIFVIDERLICYRRDTPNSLTMSNDRENKIKDSLDYLYKAYDVIKNDNSNLSRHYHIFFKFLFETNMGASLKEIQNESWFPNVKSKFDQLYNKLVSKINGSSKII
jgi:hypothetical protein